MGFPSPAADYVEKQLSLDEKFIKHPAATYFMRAANTCYRAGILQGALLVIDASLNPYDGSLLVCALDGEFRVKRYRMAPKPHLEDLTTGGKESLPSQEDNCPPAVFGVITYVINDARSGEFDDCPVM
ncbi:S24 family peptidase [Klebsiella michiganensis]|uniref:HumD family translesion DNA polymerase n=1 Tax=Klebsiella michiganensis TaxID=1134687 RepID=UPI003DA9EF7B